TWCRAGFNGAANSHSRKCRRAEESHQRIVASMGPRILTRGNYNGTLAAAIAAGSFNGAANSHSRKWFGQRRSRCTVLASMGPRILTRRNQSLRREQVYARALQWGRE